MFWLPLLITCLEEIAADPVLSGAPSQIGRALSGQRRNDLAGEYVYAWEVPETVCGSGSADTTPLTVNVSHQEALQAAGPLTLLFVLHHCASNLVLARAMEHARATRTLKLHIVGVDTKLEPSMAWKSFLIGPLSSQQALLVSAFELQAAPFADMNVSVTFNGFGHFTKHDARESLSEGYSEFFHPGLYHNVVQERPDIVIAINPGFHSEPRTWWPSLCQLHSAAVPIIVTAYETDAMTVYKQSMTGELLLHTPARSREAGTCSVHVAGDGQDAPVCMTQLSEADYLPVCGDTKGTLNIARVAGFKTPLAAQNPFMYCDDPEKSDCDSNGQVFLYEPAPSADGCGNANSSLPLSIFQWLMVENLHCTVPQELKNCTEYVVHAHPEYHSDHIDLASAHIAEECRAALDASNKVAEVRTAKPRSWTKKVRKQGKK